MPAITPGIHIHVSLASLLAQKLEDSLGFKRFTCDPSQIRKSSNNGQVSVLVLVQVDVPYPPKNVQSQHSNAHSAPHRFRQAQQLAAAPQPWVRTPAEAKTLSSSLVAFHPAGSNHDVLLWFIFYF